MTPKENSPPTWNEQDRLRAIESYDILDTPREEQFDDIVKMAARACHAPIALVSFVTSARQWFKATVGTDMAGTPLDVSICSHAILERELLVIPDTTRDARTKDNALVTGEPHVRFYAGALLKSSDGLPLGTLCVIDYCARSLTEEESFTLKALARQVMAQLELRRLLTESRRALTAKIKSQEKANFLNQLTHELSILSQPEEIDRVVTSRVGPFLGVDRCYFFQKAGQNAGKVQVLADWLAKGQASLQGGYELSRFGSPEMWQALDKGSLSIDDVRHHPWTRDFAESYEATNMVSCLLTSFSLEGKWIAGLAVSSQQARSWTLEEQALLEEVTARVWPLHERARSEVALREANILLGDKAALLESIVRQRTQRLSETVAELEAFSYSISHDMRAPLRAMIGFSEMLKEDYSSNLDATGVNYLNRISIASRRMDQLIQDVLVFSKLSREEVVLKKVDTDSLIREIIHSYPNLNPDVVDISIRSHLPEVKGSEALLTQCFSNLLENGAKFVAAGTKPQIEVWGENETERVRLYFKDNGIGIPENQLTRIFEIFQRVGRDDKGTGIGLAIVRKSVEKMGGTFGVKSELGKGSLFWLELRSA